VPQKLAFFRYSKKTVNYLTVDLVLLLKHGDLQSFNAIFDECIVIRWTEM